MFHARVLGLHWALALIAALTSACGGPSRHSSSPLSPSSLSPPPAGSGAAGAAAVPGAPAPLAGSPGAGRPVALPVESAWGALDVAFPGRDESFRFRQELERKYRDGLSRRATSSFVDIEGDLVWTQEYLRYRVNACSHTDAVQRVMDQVDGRPAAAVCGSPAVGTVAFPPRDESFAFRLELERKYRDGLGRAASATFVDVEGAIVWTQEYLRYRVNACGHAAATLKVMDQIDGRGIAAVCGADLSGTWDGASDYFNAPFVMDLVQSNSSFSGTYQDRHDTGFVSGRVVGDLVEGRVEFGDTGILIEARWDGEDVVNGDLRIGGGIGRRSFEMRRRR